MKRGKPGPRQRLRGAVLKYVPGTKPFEESRESQIVSKRRQYLGEYLSLELDSHQFDDNFAIRVGFQVYRRARSEVFLEATERIISRTFIVAMAFPFLFLEVALVNPALPSFSRDLFLQSNGVQDAIALLVLSALVTLLVSLISFIGPTIAKYSRKPTSRLKVILLYPVWSAITIIAIVFSYSRIDTSPLSTLEPLDVIRYSIVTGLAFGAAGAAFTASSQLVTLFVIPRIARLIYEDSPEPKVVSILILLLDPVMYDTGGLGLDLRMRSAWLRVLELMATHIETISAVLNTYDAPNNEQSRARFARVAAYVRSLKQAVVTPKSDTFGWLKSEVATFFRDFVLGEWDALPQADSKLMARKGVWRIVLVRGWSAAIGSMPFAAVLYLQHMGLLLDEPFRAYLPALTFLLFVVSAWIALDPEAASKLGAAKDLGALLKVPTKPKE